MILVTMIRREKRLINIQKGGRTMKIIVIITIVVILFVCFWYIHKMYKNKLIEQEIQQANQMKEEQKMNQLYSEENYAKLEKLFEKVETDLTGLVSYFDVNKIFNKETIVIRFCNENELNKYQSSHKNQIVVCDGKLLEDSTYSSLERIAEIRKYPEIVEIIERIGENDIIVSISFQVENYNEKEFEKISFSINPQQTSFIVGNNGVCNTFVFSKIPPEEMYKYGYREIKKEWYSWITPPPE